MFAVVCRSWLLVVDCAFYLLLSVACCCYVSSLLCVICGCLLRLVVVDKCCVWVSLLFRVVFVTCYLLFAGCLCIS